MNEADVDASYTGATYPNLPDDIPSPVEYLHSFLEKTDENNCRANKYILIAMFWKMHSN